MREVIVSECSIFFKSFVEADMVPVRRRAAERLMQRLVDEARETGAGKGGALELGHDGERFELGAERTGTEAGLQKQTAEDRYVGPIGMAR